jgi:hypothetical protein
MRFMKISNQHVVSASKIEQLKVTGSEMTGASGCRIAAIMDTGEVITLSRHKDFREAEIALMELTDRLEGER